MLVLAIIWFGLKTIAEIMPFFKMSFYSSKSSRIIACIITATIAILTYYWFLSQYIKLVIK